MEKKLKCLLIKNRVLKLIYLVKVCQKDYFISGPAKHGSNGLVARQKINDQLIAQLFVKHKVSHLQVPDSEVQGFAVFLCFI